MLIAGTAMTAATAQERGAEGPAAGIAVDVSKTGAKIDPNLFGQFAEHLGKGSGGGVRP